MKFEKLRKYTEPRLVAACAFWAICVFVLIFAAPYFVWFDSWLRFGPLVDWPWWGTMTMTGVLLVLYCPGLVLLMFYVAYRISKGVFDTRMALGIAAIVWIVTKDQPFQTFWDFTRFYVMNIVGIFSDV
ncbi:MAG: hypothetical protein RLN70_02110 [Rhodospirillaceae bacterium]